MSLKIEKRNGDVVSFAPQKILTRINKANKNLKTNPVEIFAKVITSVPTEGMLKTTQIDTLISELAAAYTGSHHDYSKLAAIVAISSYHKETKSSFSETMRDLASDGIINPKMLSIIEKYGADKIDAEIIHENDFNFDYFAWKSLKEMYLLRKPTGVVVERPQHMYMRVALWLTQSFEEAMAYYKSLSAQLISPATPIMINAATKIPQLASCVLHYNDGDSRDGLLGTMRDISVYSADAAGIGLCLSNIRSKESRLSSSGGYAGGLLKYLKIVNESLRFFNQQGRRPGVAAIYIEPWHKDIFDLLDIKKQAGKEEQRARDLFTALWLPDNFLQAVETDGDWYLFCPNDILKADIKPLQECYGAEYEANYQLAIESGIGVKIRAQELWHSIIESQIETGVPYLASKDNANHKSNHQNIGVLRQSNLCIEVFQATDEKTTAICTLSSVVLKNYIVGGKFDFLLLYQEVRKVVRALNFVIDINNYSTEKGEKGGREQRAIGIGVQGLADVFYLLDTIFTSPEAKALNQKIFETIYFAALTESMELCKSGEYQPYHYFTGSPISKGIFQWEMWGLTESDMSGLWDWNSLRTDIMEYGVANSLLTAQMPVASSAKITGSYEMTEPAQSAIFTRSVIGGEITIVNKYLINDFEKMGIWCEDIKDEVILHNGSIQNINFNRYLDPEDRKYEIKVKRIEHLIQKYRTIWEIPQRELIDMAAERGPYIDQSQSMNIYIANPTLSKLSSAHFYSWKRGLKTLSYYFKGKAISTGAKHLGIDVSKFDKPKEVENIPQKPKDSPFDCFGCSS